MTAPHYGTHDWLRRLPPGTTPIGRLGRMVVVRFPDGSIGKIVGGAPEAPTVIGISRAEMRDVDIGADESPTWVVWYNTSASPAEQEVFDSATKTMDAGGREYLPGGSEEKYVENYRLTYPRIYPSLVNYRDTGGRRALFARDPGTKDFGTKPISVAKPGGPIEAVDNGVTLHPGRYTYSDPLIDQRTVIDFLDRLTKERKIQVLRAQVTEGNLRDVFAPLGETISKAISPNQFVEYEFLVAVDVFWPKTMLGIPTWLPPGMHVEDYWGKPDPHSKPDWDAVRRALNQLGDWSVNLGTIAVLLGVGYLLLRFAPQPAPRQSEERARA